MAVPSVIEGRFVIFELGNGGTPEVFTPICGMFVNSFNTTVQTTDRFLRDCDLPTEIPNRKPISTGRQQDMTLSGYFTLENRALIDSLAGTERNVRLIVYEDDGVTEAGYYSGRFLFTAVNIGAPENDLATLELVLASTGSLMAWTDVAAPTLIALTLTTDTASDGVLWTSAIVGKTPGSVITASSSDSTSLVVTGASVSGTFATTGSKTITLTETQPYAVGSPMVSNDTVTVS